LTAFAKADEVDVCSPVLARVGDAWSWWWDGRREVLGEVEGLDDRESLSFHCCIKKYPEIKKY
jgi:hypothetical protein